MLRLDFALLGFAMLTVGCSTSSDLIGTAETTTESQRVYNPSGSVDAVVLRDYHDAGATGGTAFYKVLLVPKGKPAVEKDNNLILEVTDVLGYGPNDAWCPEWRGNDRVLIRLRKGRVWRFTNYVWDTTGHTVGVRLLVDGYGAG